MTLKVEDAKLEGRSDDPTSGDRGSAGASPYRVTGRGEVRAMGILCRLDSTAVTAGRGFAAFHTALRCCWSLWLGVWSFLWILNFEMGAGAASRVAWISNRVIGSPNPPAPYTVERVHPRFGFEHPVDMAFLPGSDRLFVAEQEGKLWSFDTRADAPKADLALDVRKIHQPLDSVLGFTFHPGFTSNRFVFVNYNEPGGRENGATVSRFTVRASSPPVLDPASERVVIRWLSGGHNVMGSVPQNRIFSIFLRLA